MRFKLRKQDVYSLRERFHKAEAGAIFSAFLPETPDTLKPVAEKIAFDKVIQELGPLAGQMLEIGDGEPFLHLLALYGPRLLAEPSVMEWLHWRWMQARWQEQPEGKAAKQFFEQLGQALSWGPRGQHRKHSDTERQELRRSGSRTAQNDRRALRYCDRAWNSYTKETKGVRDIRTLRRIARDIARKELSCGSAAKQEGVRLFLRQVQASGVQLSA